MSDPALYLIAGPNGAGKTTYAFRHIRAVSGSDSFVNLDEIARGLSPLNPDLQASRAARIALDLTRDLITQKRTFSVETTLSGRTHLRTLHAARAAGVMPVLLYFAMQTPDSCLARIARRVSEGGHDVPEGDVRRRFARSIANLPDYAALSHPWRIFDASNGAPKVVAEGRGLALDMLGETGGLPDALTRWLDDLARSQNSR